MNILLRNVIRDALNEVQRCPNDSIQDIFNAFFESWELPYWMNNQFVIEEKQ